MPYSLRRPERLRQKEEEARKAVEAENAEMRSRLDRLGDRPERLVDVNARLTAQVEALQDRWRTSQTRHSSPTCAPQRTGHVKPSSTLASGAANGMRPPSAWRASSSRWETWKRHAEINVGLERQNAGLRAALDEMGERWGELQAEEAEKKPFVTLSSYDEDPDMHRVPSTRSGGVDLGKLATEVRQRMAGEREFYYAATDVRLFLAGLASSRLHLLQGISGTGKTSLPIEFFRALGGQSSVVEVQAGWRDKDDLFGFYNAFEKRFAETEFTKALYRALLPANADLPTVIVLDEMNLAHPEQYFSDDAVQAGERDAEWKGPRHPERVRSRTLPTLFDGVHDCRSPRNVWFVGTANHDETTVRSPTRPTTAPTSRSCPTRTRRSRRVINTRWIRSPSPRSRTHSPGHKGSTEAQPIRQSGSWPRTSGRCLRRSESAGQVACPDSSTGSCQ